MTNTDQTVADVLAQVNDSGDYTKLEGVLCGSLGPSELNYEDWVKPMKLTGGRVCLREESRYANSAFWYGMANDTLHAYYDGDGRKASGPEAVIWLKSALTEPENLTPVLREETPFGGDP